MVTIHVTAGDIAAGSITSCENCPVAQAIMRTLGLPHVSVGLDDMDLGRHVAVLVPTPARASHFMRLFDGGHKVEPFSFELDVPDELVPAGAAS